MKILLIEPNYKTSILPLGLQKIASYHLKKKDRVVFSKGVPQIGFVNKFYPDIIYIASLFVYYGQTVLNTIKQCQRRYPNSKIKVGGVFASLMPELIKQETGITPHKGLLKKVENCIPDYSLFPKTDKATIFTTRGCIRKCGFCAVKTLEPEFHIIKNWGKQFQSEAIQNKDIFLIQDNNFLATRETHQKNVVSFLEKNLPEKLLDFNSGFDARIYNEKHARLYQNLIFSTIRFAFDTIKENGYIQKAIGLAYKYRNFKINPIVYVLFNYEDTPEETYYKIKECIKLGANVYPMKYAPLDDINGKKYAGKNWTYEQLKKFDAMIKYSSHGTKFFFGYNDHDYSIKRFESIAGRNEKEFVDFISTGRKKLKTKIFTKKPKKKGFLL